MRQLAPALAGRQRLTRAVRDFFLARDYLEVTTPVAVPAPALEEHIDCPAGTNNLWLRASPELHMKRLLAALNRPIFQLGPCFRQNERGSLHLPEFTMLEWYRTNADCMDILTETKALVRYCFEQVKGRQTCRFRQHHIDFSAEWRALDVAEAFVRFADLPLDRAVEQDCFEQLLVEQVLPKAGGEAPLVLHGFPLSLGALARKDPETDRADRWELFAGGVELANAYSELTDHDEQIERWQRAAAIRRTRKMPVYPVDNNYLQLLRHGFPACAGIALGFDRLLMVLMDKSEISQVTPFPPEAEKVSELAPS